MANENKERRALKLLKGTVVSDKGDKTILVKISRRVKHLVYGKYITLYKKYSVHDEENKASIGDFVSICASRPVSKTKRWRLFNVDKRKVD